MFPAKGQETGWPAALERLCLSVVHFTKYPLRCHAIAPFSVSRSLLPHLHLCKSVVTIIGNGPHSYFHVLFMHRSRKREAVQDNLTLLFLMHSHEKGHDLVLCMTQCSCKICARVGPGSVALFSCLPPVS